MDLFNEGAHVSFRSQVLAFNVYSHPDRSEVADLLVARIDAHRDFVQDISHLFATGKDRREVLETHRFRYTHPHLSQE